MLFLLWVNVVFFRTILILVDLQIALCIVNDLSGKLQHLGNLDTVTLFNLSLVNSVLELQVVCVVDLTCRVHIGDARDLFFDLDHFVEMSRE